MALRTKAAAHAATSDPPPRIDPETKIKDLVVCHISVVRSEWGPCPEGQIMRADHPLVLAAPDAFRPLAEHIG